MVLLWPWWLLALAVVAAVAAWTLFRPRREVAVVGSLALWREALGSLGRSKRRASQRVTACWALLLLGALAAVLAASRPVARSGSFLRHVAVAIYPSAELATDEGLAQVRRTAEDLVGRLGPDDKVQLLLPLALGGAGDWLSIAQAKARINGVPLLPEKADELVMPPPSPEAQHVYHVAPAQAVIAGGPDVSLVDVPSHLAPVTIDAVGAAPLPSGQVQLFVAMRNRTGLPWTGRLSLTILPEPGAAAQESESVPVTVEAGKRRELVRSLPPAAALAVELVGDGTAAAGEALPSQAAPGSSAFLARRAARVTSVAMLGPDEPMLRRFVQINPALELVADVRDAEVVIANAADPPPDRPAIVFNSPAAPPGWRRGETLDSVVLAGADVASDDPVMRHVNLEPVAIRHLSPWVAGGSPTQKRLVSYKGDAVILRNEPAEFETDTSKRIFVAFDVGAENTNFSTESAFVIFLTNAIDWLKREQPRASAVAPTSAATSPAVATASGRASVVYDYVSPLRAGPVPLGAGLWRRIVGQSPPGGGAGGRAPLPWPGIYADQAGDVLAVSLVGMGRETPQTASRPLRPQPTNVSDVPLPEPVFAGGQAELWPWLVIAAMILWLAGWSARLR